MITEFLDGGELFEKVISPDFDLTEKECALFMRQICQAVAYLHEKVIINGRVQFCVGLKCSD